MGEQPIFTTKAHVFQIDPETKKKWIPSASQAISVSYYYDSTRNTYRIISVDGTKALVNSTITPNMTFTKTSQKFGQWSDQRSNTVYGLGFSSEADLNKFVDKFKEVKEMMRQTENDGTPNGNTSLSDTLNNSITMNNADKGSLHKTSPASSPKPVKAINAGESGNTTPDGRHNSPHLASTITGTSTSVVDQLKYENDRLKIALAQSSANAKKWEVELQTLKNNNARLTTALQESTSNVEEWKRQLAAYKEESARMKKKVLEMEKNGSGGGTELLQRQIVDMRDKASSSERQLQEKDEELRSLTQKMDGLKVVETKNKQLTDQMKTLENEKSMLAGKVEEIQRQRDTAEVKRVRERQNLLLLQQQLSKLTAELSETSDKMADSLKSQAHS